MRYVIPTLVLLAAAAPAPAQCPQCGGFTQVGGRVRFIRAEVIEQPPIIIQRPPIVLQESFDSFSSFGGCGSQFAFPQFGGFGFNEGFRFNGGFRFNEGFGFNEGLRFRENLRFNEGLRFREGFGRGFNGNGHGRESFSLRINEEAGGRRRLLGGGGFLGGRR